MKFRLATATAVAAMLVLTACGGPADTNDGAGEVTTTAWGAQVLERGEPQDGGTLRYGLRTVVESLDPVNANPDGNLIMRSLYGMLFTFDEHRNVVPDMAESIETDDDGLTWTLKLEPGHMFTDGTPYDAEAVKSHFTRMASDGSRSRFAGDMRQIAHMDVVNSETLVITLRERWNGFPYLLVGAFPGGPSWVPSPAAVAEHGDAIATNPVGAGPFMLESFAPGGDIVLVKNPEYAGDQPFVDRLEFVVATDTQTRISAGIAGDLDLGRTQSATDLSAAVEGGLTGLTQPDTTFYHLLMNLSAAPFDDERFRRAVAHAIDRDGLNAAVFGGEHDVMAGYMSPTSPYYVDTSFPSFDPDEARRLIDEYTADTGNPAAFSLTTAAQPENQQQAVIIQQMLDEVGISVTINIADQPTIVTEVRGGNFQSQLRFIEVSHALNARTHFHSTSGANNGLAGDEDVDRILDEMLTAPEAEMDALYGELQHALTAWLPTIPLVLQQNGIFVSDRVGGYPGNITGTPDPDFRYVWLRGEG